MPLENCEIRNNSFAVNPASRSLLPLSINSGVSMSVWRNKTLRLIYTFLVLFGYTAILYQYFVRTAPRIRTCSYTRYLSSCRFVGLAKFTHLSYRFYQHTVSYS
ncbi:hypothetical protein XNC1_2961 [Xenorhabdus nematophila ATCC 19061]|uniref:Uncharacterized protein n=1 Tax=Xenorhabdus nematophila (strain ATCC 19061 / DSM 3370 / CCUG 14189 / LMG 1036 / NCIMB 9965 / AN6) TaxID=406817 RepID=D3VJV6_XENNA|nr:hypothetical protein XNC1_2961 [Xenorhabdus nematophila ATCC 19061]